MQKNKKKKQATILTAFLKMSKKSKQPEKAEKEKTDGKNITRKNDVFQSRT